MGDYRKLLVWRKSHELALEVYRVTDRFPDHERFGLTAQLRRGGVSIAANIAEGTGRGTERELARFCRMALGSLNELEYHYLLAKDLGYVDAATHALVAQHCAELRRMLTRFVQSLAAAPA